MKTAIFISTMALALVGPATAQSSDPAGWLELIQAIDAANPSDPSNLKGRKFTVTVSGAKPEDTLEVRPAEAFAVTRSSPNKFVVEIVDATRLVISGGLKRFAPVGWKVTQNGINPFAVAIEGNASCLYKARFSQKGGSELSLAGLEEDYAVTHEFTNPQAIASVERDDRGLSIARAQNSPVRVRLHIVGKTNGDDLYSNWIDIPTCATPEQIVVAQPKPEPIPTPAVTATDCMSRKVIAVSHCTAKCGTSTSTLTVRYENTCSATVRCDPVYWASYQDDNEYGASGSYWISLNGSQSTSLDITLASPNTGSFSFRPKFQSCKFV